MSAFFIFVYYIIMEDDDDFMRIDDEQYAKLIPLDVDRYDEEYVNIRTQDIENIAADVIHLKGMMDDLSDLVYIQQEDIAETENNIDTSSNSVKNAYNDIVASEKYQQSSYKYTMYLSLMASVGAVVLFGIIR